MAGTGRVNWREVEALGWAQTVDASSAPASLELLTPSHGQASLPEPPVPRGTLRVAGEGEGSLMLGTLAPNRAPVPGNCPSEAYMHRSTWGAYRYGVYALGETALFPEGAELRSSQPQMCVGMAGGRVTGRQAGLLSDHGSHTKAMKGCG